MVELAVKLMVPETPSVVPPNILKVPPFSVRARLSELLFTERVAPLLMVMGPVPMAPGTPLASETVPALIVVPPE